MRYLVTIQDDYLPPQCGGTIDIPKMSLDDAMELMELTTQYGKVFMAIAELKECDGGPEDAD